MEHSTAPWADTCKGSRWRLERKQCVTDASLSRFSAASGGRVWRPEPVDAAAARKRFPPAGPVGMCETRWR